MWRRGENMHTSKRNWVLVLLAVLFSGLAYADPTSDLKAGKTVSFEKLADKQSLAYHPKNVENRIDFLRHTDSADQKLMSIGPIDEWSNLQFTRDRRKVFFKFSDTGSLGPLFLVDGETGIVTSLCDASNGFKTSPTGHFVLFVNERESYPVAPKTNFRLFNVETRKLIDFQIDVSENEHLSEANGFEIFRDQEGTFKITMYTDGGGLLAAYRFDCYSLKITDIAFDPLRSRSGKGDLSDDVDTQYNDMNRERTRI